MTARRQHPLGTQFDEGRTEKGRGNMTVFFDNLTGISAEAGSTHFDHLLAIAQKSHKPFPVKYLHPKLKDPEFPRGKTYFGYAVVQILKILVTHPELRWWMEEDGLVVDEVPPALDSLSLFDRIVGPLSVQLQKNGKLSRDAVNSIARELDAKGFKLKNHLQPKEWEEIVLQNRKRTGNPIRSFSAAAINPRLGKFVRRSIYRARTAYKKALSLRS